MSLYGFCITDKGYALIAKLVAGKTLSLSRIMVGSGACADDQDPRALTDLIEPVAAATSTVPAYDGNRVSFIVEYRSDLNGGLDHGFWLNEYGVYAYDPDDGEVLIYYGCLGDYPQWVSAASSSGIDVRRYPVTIEVGESTGVEADFSYEAWMTAEDVAEYCTVTILPVFLGELLPLIEAHNTDPDAHLDIRNLITDMNTRLSLLELMFSTDVAGNPFAVTFETLDGTVVEGVWNEAAIRIEF